jgi:hypothetical protein
MAVIREEEKDDASSLDISVLSEDQFTGIEAEDNDRIFNILHLRAFFFT